MTADVSQPGEAMRACHGAAVVYHCANPSYHRWAELHPPLMNAIIQGAASANARLVFGDDLYAYGPVDGPLIETLPNRAAGPSGRARVAAAETLLQANESGLLRATIGRGSDFFGPHVRQSLVGERVFANAVAGKPAQMLGNPDLPHTVTFIDDFAPDAGHAGRTGRGARAGMARPECSNGDDEALRPDRIHLFGRRADSAGGTQVGPGPWLDYSTRRSAYLANSSTKPSGPGSSTAPSSSEYSVGPQHRSRKRSRLRPPGG